MSSNLFETSQLIAVISVYCAIFCPILCWVLGGTIAPAKFVSPPESPSVKSALQ